MRRRIPLLLLLAFLTLACNLVNFGANGSTPSPQATAAASTGPASTGPSPTGPAAIEPAPTEPAASQPPAKVITGAHIEGPPQFYPRSGDIWQTTWADDGNVYVTWGDGTGRRDCCGTLDPAALASNDACQAIPPSVSFFDVSFGLTAGQCQANNYCFCDWSDAGLGILHGPIKAPDPCQGDCIVSLNVPSGRPIDPTSPTPRNSKPSSLLFYGGRLYWAGIYQVAETPQAADAPSPDYGYIAYSDDYGQNWTEVENSPWSPENDSHFVQIMFINMGQAYRLNKDGYVYALAKDFGAWSFVEGAQERPANYDVYLARVPRDRIVGGDGSAVDPILDYSAYEYYAGADGSGQPLWTAQQGEAIPVPGLQSLDKGGVMYHPGTGQYLFLTARPSGLFVAPQPWGPWRLVADLLSDPVLMDPTLAPEGWTGGGYIPGLITKDAGPDSFYFTMSGVGGAEHYQLTIGQIVLEQ
jgi:hypothetical protein